MPRYIDADKLKETITDNFLNPYERNHIHNLIDIQPTADVQEVVYCKDCKYSCSFTSKENDFCSRGEKMDGE